MLCRGETPVNAPNEGARSALKGGILTEPCDRVVFATNDVVAGEFRCPATYPGFLTAGRINHYIVAFPRTAVWIERERAPRFVADPSFATIYNPGQPYLRHPISPDGDLSDWLGVSECLARDAVRRFNPGDADHPEPLRHVRAPVSHGTYLAQRLLFSRLSMVNVDELEVEERALSIFIDVLDAAYAPTGRKVASPHRGRPRRDLVESTKAAVMSRLFENASIGDLARDVHIAISPVSLVPRRDRKNASRVSTGYPAPNRARPDGIVSRKPFDAGASRWVLQPFPLHHRVPPRVRRVALGRAMLMTGCLLCFVTAPEKPLALPGVLGKRDERISQTTA